MSITGLCLENCVSFGLTLDTELKRVATSAIVCSVENLQCLSLAGLFLTGEVSIGFVEENGGRSIGQNVSAGQSYVIPQGNFTHAAQPSYKLSFQPLH